MSKDQSSVLTTWRFPKRVAYVVNHSLPYSSDGYAVRTHEIAKALGGFGHDVLVINRPGRPWNIEGFPKSTQVAPSQTIDGVRYVFLPLQTARAPTLRGALRQAEKTLLDAFEIFRPGAVIAASNWENAEPALYAARRWGAAFFYEQRGFWELSQAEKEPGYAQSLAFSQVRDIELRISKDAKAVFTLNTAMRDELVRRGVPKEKILLVPNGVSKPAPVTLKVTRHTLGCKAKYLLGYVGSLSPYEGEDDLIEVLGRLRAQGVDVDLLVVGSNAPKGLVVSDHIAPPENSLARKIEKAGLVDHVHLTGQVPRDCVGAYYALLDAVVMPRKRAAVTQLVAPLKPYAAASCGVPVFMPDMAPLDDVAKDIHASLYPEGDLAALTAMLRDTLENGGHPAVLNPLPQHVFWHRRVQPMSQALRAVAQETPAPDTGSGAPPQGRDMDAVTQAGPRFNIQKLPHVALRKRSDQVLVAAIGPCAHLPLDTQITQLTRVNILSELATQIPVGRFMIDWRGLESDPKGWPKDWDGLWSTDNMRLNRLMMDACAIALDRGWQIQIIGPVARSRAPLFRTVAQAFEEIILHPDMAEGTL